MSTPHYTTQPRKPKGTPVGGRWSERELDPAQVSLVQRKGSHLRVDPKVAELIDARRSQLEAQGFVPATITPAAASPSTTARIAQWWDKGFLNAEFTSENQAIPQMPQDYTPARTSGRAITGHRRTHRMRYQTGAGVEVRMPSRTAINRFMNETGNDTIDVPVAAEAPGAPAIQGWVRVTRLAPGRFSAEGLGMGGKTEVIVAESVAAAMEGRSAQRSLNSYSDMVARRQERIAAMGVEPTQVASTWIDGVAYDEKAGVMYSGMTSGRTYGHKVPKPVYDKLVSASSPGAVFNREVKGQADRIEGVERCGKCGRFTAAAGPAHICPKEQTKSDAILSNRLAAGYLGLADLKAAVKAPQGSPATAPPVEHVRAEQEARVDVARMWADRAAGPAGGQPVYGPRGFTAEAAAIIAPNTSSSYLPIMYRTSLNGDDSANSGSLVRFTGVQSHQALALRDTLARHDHLEERQNDGPSNRTLLAAAVDEPGTIELHGYMISPDRRDERVIVEGVNVYDDELADRVQEIVDEMPAYPRDEDPEELAEWQEARAACRRQLQGVAAQVCEKYGLDPAAAADEVHVSENPWRPGERSVYLAWD